MYRSLVILIKEAPKGFLEVISRNLKLNYYSILKASNSLLKISCVLLITESSPSYIDL